MAKRKSGRKEKIGIWRGKNRGNQQIFRQFKRGGESRIPRLDSYNKYNILAIEMNVNALETERKIEVRKTEKKTLREVTVKIGLERIDMQEGITVEVLLDSWATVLVMSSKFAKKQGFKLKKLERPMNMRNVDGSLNKEELIEHTVEATLYDY